MFVDCCFRDYFKVANHKKIKQNILKFYVYKQSKMHTCCSSGKVANIALVNAA